MSVDDRVMYSTLDVQFDCLLILYSQSSFMIFNICTLSSSSKFIRLWVTASNRKLNGTLGINSTWG